MTATWGSILREHWKSLAPLIAVFAWVTWRFGVDLALVLLLLLLLIGKMYQLFEVLRDTTLATGEMCETTSKMVMAQNEVIRAHLKLPKKEAPAEETVH